MKSIVAAGTRKRQSPSGTRSGSLRTSKLSEYFSSTQKTAAKQQSSDIKKWKQNPSGASKRQKSSTLEMSNSQAEEWGNRLDQSPRYLTDDGKSWFIFVKQWLPTPSPEAFEKEWNLHPNKRHSLRVFGRTVLEKRWSQSWGVAYAYSGATNQARPLEKDTMVVDLLDKANALSEEETDDDANIKDDDDSSRQRPYNGCLQNWYTPDDSIGLHADDEKCMRKEYPILSLSWGGTRRFLLRRKQKKNDDQDVVELWLEDGDLLVMGGTCQETHKHEVPKRRVTKDPETDNRINWTIRAFSM